VRALVALLALAALGGCAKPERLEAPVELTPHLGEAWYSYRAATLGITPEAAVTRDLAISELRPPELDRIARLEAAAVWRDHCASCHGIDGDAPPRAGPAPRSWGTVGSRMGFRFGGDSMRAGLYRKIQDGGKTVEGRVSDMPSWRRLLSREQTWALVERIESF
jgi:mono/diheme cytochrome c family protein